MNKIFFYNKFIIRLYVFRALCAHHQEVKISLYSIWYHHTCSYSPSEFPLISFSVLHLDIFQGERYERITQMDYRNMCDDSRCCI